MAALPQAGGEVRISVVPSHGSGPPPAITSLSVQAF
jgi:hypothetical protein